MLNVFFLTENFSIYWLCYSLITFDRNPQENRFHKPLKSHLYHLFARSCSRAWWDSKALFCFRWKILLPAYMFLCMLMELIAPFVLACGNWRGSLSCLFSFLGYSWFTDVKTEIIALSCFSLASCNKATSILKEARESCQYFMPFLWHWCSQCFCFVFLNFCFHFLISIWISFLLFRCRKYRTNLPIYLLISEDAW